MTLDEPVFKEVLQLHIFPMRERFDLLHTFGVSTAVQYASFLKSYFRR